MSKLFRKEALNNIASPEQLDQQVRIVKPFHWLGALGALLLITGVIIWGFFGNINSTTQMQGLIFPKAGVEPIICQNPGAVGNVLYSVGDTVTKGDIIAVIPDEEKLAAIEKKQEEIKDAAPGQRAERKKELEKLYSDYENHSIICASESGTIQNIVRTGDILEEGDEIANILVNSQYSNNRQIAAYVPLTVAKRLKLGMEMQICPSYLTREEYGYMEGYVSSIGEVPVTEESLRSYYGNLEYVSDILPSQSCVEVLISIQVDEESANHFKWSNVKGESVSVEVGTVCDIQAVVEKKRPIDLLF